MQRWLPAYGKGVAVLILIALSLVVETASCCHRAMGFDASLESTSWQPMGTLDARIPPHNRELRQVLIDMVDQKILTESRPQAGSSGTELALQRPSNRPASSAASPLRKRNTSKEGRSQRGSHATRAPSTNSSNSSSASKNTSPTTPRVARRSHRLSIRSRAANFSRSRTAAKSEKPAAAPANPFTDPQQSPKTAAPKPPVAKNFPLPRIDPSTPTGKTTRANLPPLTSGQQRLRSKVRRVLTQYYNRPLNTRDRSPWEVLHAILTYEIHSKVLRGGPRGEPITAVGWLCFNQPCKRRTLMYVDKKGGLQVRVGPGLQGHRGQLLAMLAQAHVKKEYPMRVDGHDFTVADLIEMEKRTCYPRTELTFKLIGLMNYLDSDAQWMNDQGLQWNIPKLISEELQQPVRGAACGGTHRLTGLTLAYKKRLQRGEPLDGEYLKAKKFVARYQHYAYRLQNRDGSFSTEWFRGSGREESIDRRLKTTGHILEWLLYAASEKELKSGQTARAANYLANLMYNNRQKDWESGPLGHAIHALLLYDQLVFAPYDKQGKLPVAAKAKASVARRAKR